eukprot:5294182-Pleurochrysis_carterae.AAC.2
MQRIELSVALNNVSNYRHQSWYVHYLVWIVPQQIFLYGNSWKFSTCAIESRGGQLKKYRRKTVSWWPLSATFVVYNHVDRRTGLPVRRTQSYSSSPMEQMLKRIVAREEASHDADNLYARLEALRLKQQLRKCKLKCELPDLVDVDDAFAMIDALQKRRASS